MERTKRVNGYNITYGSRCKHLNLRGFKNKQNFTCLDCGAECQFCSDCDRVFTLNTLLKYDGICGQCHALFMKAIGMGHNIDPMGYDDGDDGDGDNEEMDLSFMTGQVTPPSTQPSQPSRPRKRPRDPAPERPIDGPGPLFPIQLILPLGPPPKKKNTETEAEDVPMSDKVPLSERHMTDEDKKDEEEFEEGEYKVKNILAEDCQKKKWLVEWEGEDVATWESFEILKDSKVFQQHIEQRMTEAHKHDHKH